MVSEVVIPRDKLFHENPTLSKLPIDKGLKIANSFICYT